MNISIIPSQKNSYWNVNNSPITSTLPSSLSNSKLLESDQTQNASVQNSPIQQSYNQLTALNNLSTQAYDSGNKVDLSQISKFIPELNESSVIQNNESNSVQQNNESNSVQQNNESNSVQQNNESNSVQQNNESNSVQQNNESGGVENKNDDVSNESKKNTVSDKEGEFSEQELKVIDILQKVDSEVRAHEMAHVAAGGQYVSSGAQLEYLKGPDGKRYAVAGKVSIDTSPIPGNPQATLAKMRQVQQAALAPASPSSQDIKVASSAAMMASKALSELIISKSKSNIQGNQSTSSIIENQNENRSITQNSNDTQIQSERQKNSTQSQNIISIKMRNAADSYSKISAMPIEPQVSRFKIAA